MFGTGPGYPQSQQMGLTERYRRVNYSTLDVTLTIDDSMAYTGPRGDQRHHQSEPEYGTLGVFLCTLR